MNEIENLNTLGCCNEKFCSRPATYYEVIKVNNMDVYISLCNKHSEIWDTNKGGLKNGSTN